MRLTVRKALSLGNRDNQQSFRIYFRRIYKNSKIGPSTESLNADFFQFLAKLSKILHKIVARNSSLTGDVSEDVSKFNKFPVASVSRTGDEAFFAYHVIT